MEKRATVHRPRDPALTSKLMSKVRAKENRAEVMLRKELWRRGLRYRMYARNLPGTPDIVFPRARSVLFVDGDFWHGRLLIEEGEQALLNSFRTDRRDFWIAKIHRNVERDKRNTTHLRSLGWLVIRVWERDILRDLVGVANRVEASIRSELQSKP